MPRRIWNLAQVFGAMDTMTKSGNKMRATMIDVARAAGVSLKTVSRVLNGEVYVREDTRDAVIKAASELRYEFNQAARTLRAGGAQIVALLVNNPSRSYLENVHMGALKQCHKMGLQLILDECEDGADGLRHFLDTISPVGVIITPPLCYDAAVLKLLEERGVHYVLITPANDRTDAPLVTIDDERAAHEMTEYLISIGHSRIGFIKGHPDHGASTKRYNGYLNALAKAGIDADDSIIRQGYFDWASGLQCAESLLDMANRPTAIFASNDDMAASVITACYRRDIHVPRHLSVVGFDNTAIASIISPQLSTVNQPIADLATEAVNILTGLISPMRKSAISVHLEYTIIKRESVAAPQ
jgi:LacI family transcriptional regulator